MSEAGSFFRFYEIKKVGSKKNSGRKVPNNLVSAILTVFLVSVFLLAIILLIFMMMTRWKSSDPTEMSPPTHSDSTFIDYFGDTDHFGLNKEEYSDFTDEVFECSGHCYCSNIERPEYEERRNVIGGILGRTGIKILLRAGLIGGGLTSIYHTAKNSIQDKCIDIFISECPEDLIRSEVDECEEYLTMEQSQDTNTNTENEHSNTKTQYSPYPKFIGGPNCGPTNTKIEVLQELARRIPDRLIYLSGEEVDFGNECIKHDVCYAECIKSRDQCDQEFGENLRNSCLKSMTINNAARRRCIDLANIYELAVESVGSFFYKC